jgi:transcriptional regulator with GAF, ATPase, and Fis domain
MSVHRLFYDHAALSSPDESVQHLLRCVGAGGTTCVAWAAHAQSNAEESVVVFLNSSAPESVDRVVAIGRRHPDRVLVVLLREAGEPSLRISMRLLSAGAGDVIALDSPDQTAELVMAIVSRWSLVDSIIESDLVIRNVIGSAGIWRRLLRQVVEAARFTQAPVIITGETGTGKELVARLVHTLDPKRHERNLIVVDCTTLQPELTGSELFGHQRGAFTGAVAPRDGALALADGGTLFLDEIGELPLVLQAQLLRAIQERIYKPVGGNTWMKSNFRLVCATNRDLKDEVAAGRFRSDLYYRIAGVACRTPPLRERVEDIPLLANHFLREALDGAPPPVLSPAVLEYVIARDYPGNVRDLRLLMQSMARSYIGTGSLTVRGIPEDQRQTSTTDETPAWRDEVFEQTVRRALMLGAPLKDIGRAAEEIAVRVVLSETESTGEAARRLGVSPRAIQARRASMDS